MILKINWKSILFFRLFKSENSKYHTSLNFNAREYNFASEESIISPEIIKEVFSKKISEMNFENTDHSFNGVMFKDGFPSNQLSTPKELTRSNHERFYNQIQRFRFRKFKYRH